MEWKQKVSESMKKVGDGAGKVYGMGKAKAEELHLEMQMDAVAKKIGYQAYEEYRGREVSLEKRREHLQRLMELDEALNTVKAEAAARAEAAHAPQQAAPQTPPPPDAGTTYTAGPTI